MANYKLVNHGSSGKIKHPVHTYCADWYAQEHFDLYLSEEMGHRYRLHAREPHFTDDFLPYMILCPHCKREMKCIGGPKTLHELGLYECRCSKH